MAEITAPFFRSAGYPAGMCAVSRKGTMTFLFEDDSAASVIRLALESGRIWANDIGEASGLPAPEEIKGNRYPWLVCSISGGNQWDNTGTTREIREAAAKAVRITSVDIVRHAG